MFKSQIPMKFDLHIGRITYLFVKIHFNFCQYVLKYGVLNIYPHHFNTKAILRYFSLITPLKIHLEKSLLYRMLKFLINQIQLYLKNIKASDLIFHMKFGNEWQKISS